MKKIFVLVLSLLFTVSAFAQVETLWERTSLGSNLPSWMGASTERGLAYSMTEDHLYVVSRASGVAVKVIDAEDGTDIGDLSTTDITGGTYPLNDIGVSWDGKIYAANLALNTNSFKIYTWENESADPTVAFDSDLSVSDKRLGDKITVAGNAADNTLQVWAVDANNNIVYVFGTTDNGATLTQINSITMNGTAGSTPSAYPVFDPDEVAFVTNGNGQYPTAYDATGEKVTAVPSSLIGTGSNAIALFEINNLPYAAVFQYGTGADNANIISLDMNPDAMMSVATTPSMYQASSGGNGDVDVHMQEDGSVEVFVLSTNNGIGAYKFTVEEKVDGKFVENYNEAAMKQNDNAGFGNAIDVEGLYYRFDGKDLYIGVDGILDVTNSNGIVLFLDLSPVTGIASGTALGGVTDGGHLFGSTDNGNFMNDFETDYGFVINPGGSADNVYIDMASYVNGEKTAQYLGNTDQSGTVGEGPADNGIFDMNSVQFAFMNVDGERFGLELKIPYSQFPRATDEIQMMAAVVSNTGYFSDVTVPGDVSGGNLGNNPDFMNIAGGPFHSNAAPVPVELSTFTASSNGSNAILKWTTITEKNNMGFDIERSYEGGEYAKVSHVKGAGTSLDAVNYSFTDAGLAKGSYTYRLKQIDYDGSYEYSQSVEVDINAVPTAFTLNQNYPNPFNPSTKINFSVDATAFTTLEVYNILGEKESVLFSEMAESGKVYEVDFNAGNMSAGVYFYTLSSGSKTITKKMMLLK